MWTHERADWWWRGKTDPFDVWRNDLKKNAVERNDSESCLTTSGVPRCRQLSVKPPLKGCWIWTRVSDKTSYDPVSLSWRELDAATGDMKTFPSQVVETLLHSVLCLGSNWCAQCDVAQTCQCTQHGEANVSSASTCSHHVHDVGGLVPWFYLSVPGNTCRSFNSSVDI